MASSIKRKIVELYEKHERNLEDISKSEKRLSKFHKKIDSKVIEEIIKFPESKKNFCDKYKIIKDISNKKNDLKNKYKKEIISFQKEVRNVFLNQNHSN